MKIKRLELVGFKSFAAPTVIDFDAPITGVVGPNGCGKSNVVDAIRWVMGEMSPKSLRGRSMEDVIFNGSDSRQALGYAEVSLTFSTEDGIAPATYAGFTEITVTRRLYRSGESEYLINKVASRLRDVVDLFLGTGVGHRAYSIIEQGKIDFVINSKPEDRRLLLEEAAGISKFKARKEAALRKIESTEQNLTRLRDILSEVVRQINSLDRQVKKAEKYRILKNELRELELKLSSYQYHLWTRDITTLRQELEDVSLKEASIAAEVGTLDNVIQTGRLELTEKDRAYNQAQEKFFETSSRLQLLEAQEDFQRKEHSRLENEIAESLAEIEEIKQRLTQTALDKIEQEKNIEAIHTHSTTLHSDLEVAQKEWQEFESIRESLNKKLDLIRNALRQLESESVRLESEKRLFEERSIAVKGQIAKAEVESLETRKRFDLHLSQRELKKEDLRLCSEKYSSYQGTIDALKSKMTEQNERHGIFKQELHIRNEELVVKRSRLRSLQDLERNFEGYEEGVRSLFKSKKEEGRHQGIFGVVADLVETSPRYELAVSAALGDKLQYVVIKSHEEGVEAINYLKTQSAGRSSFIPVSVRSGQAGRFTEYLGENPSTSGGPTPHRENLSGFHGEIPEDLSTDRGVIGPLLQHVNVKEGYQKVAQYLFNDVLVIDNLERALSLWQNGITQNTLVTLDGEVVDPSGVVSGGSTGIRGKMLLEKKREIKELRELCAELEEDIGLKEDTLSQLEGNLSEMNLELETLLREQHQEELRQLTLTKEVQHIESEYTRLEHEIEKSKATSSHLGEDMEKISQFLTDYISKNELISQKTTEQQVLYQSTEEELRERQSQGRERQEHLTTLRIQVAAMQERLGMASREMERLKNTEFDLNLRLDQKMTMITEDRQKNAHISQTLESATAEKTLLKSSVTELAASQEIARQAYEQFSQELFTKEETLREHRKVYQEAQTRLGDLRVNLSKLETEISNLDQQILEKYSVSLATLQIPEFKQPQSGAEGEAPAALPMEGATQAPTIEEEKTLAELKERLERMGDVNLGAIPEYEELQVRRQFLEKQVQDLDDSIDGLKKAIHRINQTTRDRFEETFHAVNERFQTLFPRLFQGGRSELRLTEGEDLLNAGVELMVQPRGKKLSHVGLLSGGEKAMSAIAFIFSIFLVKPSPFCILDEVDAPLDDLNADRFHKLLTEMINRTQFILITHNRRTMEKADLLYGVTMREPGVSQVVSVRLKEGLEYAQ